jgi:hypothetical protein
MPLTLCQVPLHQLMGNRQIGIERQRRTLRMAIIAPSLGQVWNAANATGSR